MAQPENPPEWVKRIVDSLGQAQAINRANHFILAEVVNDMARQSKDPEKYLATMFERISARADRTPIEKEAHPVNAEFRWTIETFFSLARKRLKK